MDELTRLAHNARLGDERALDALVQAIYPDVWRLCGVLADVQAAEDLAQETLLRATASLRHFRGEASARTWILAIARRVCVDELRARQRQVRRAPRPQDADDGEAPSAVAPDPAGEVAAHDLLRRLEPDRRAAFVLTQLFRFSYEEAAAICGCPVGTIRSRVARAREQLIELIAASPAGVEQVPRRLR